MKISPQALKEITEAFRRYEAEVEASLLKLSTKNTYLLHSRSFVRWLADDFVPGATKTDPLK